jgi:hypothetical protein
VSQYAAEQIFNGTVRTTTVTAPSGEIIVTPATSFTFPFMRVKRVCSWGVTGGQISNKHIALTGDALSIATPKVIDEAVGVSDKPFALLPFTTDNKLAYGTATESTFVQTRFSGFVAGLDPTVVIDYELCLFG